MPLSFDEFLFSFIPLLLLMLASLATAAYLAQRAKPWLWIIFSLQAASGTLLILSLFFSIVGLIVLSYSAVTLAAALWVARARTPRERSIRALACGAVLTMFIGTGLEDNLRQYRAVTLRVQAWEALLHSGPELPAQLGEVALALPYSPQIWLRTRCQRPLDPATSPCSSLWLDDAPGNRKLFLDATPPTIAGHSAQLVELTLAPVPVRRGRVLGEQGLEWRDAPNSEWRDWCARHPERADQVWCAGTLSARVTLTAQPGATIETDPMDLKFEAGRYPALAPDADGDPVQIRCHRDREKARQEDPRIAFPWCRIRFAPVPGLSASFDLDGVSDDDIHATAVRIRAELAPFVQAMIVQP